MEKVSIGSLESDVGENKWRRRMEVGDKTCKFYKFSCFFSNSGFGHDSRTGK